MEQNTPSSVDNRIFRDTFLGVLLFIAALAFTFIKSSYTPTFNIADVSILSLLAGSGAALLYKTVKKDKLRLGKNM